ncbi:flagellar brake protein [Zestomonas carbonaria]|uniref:Flagellar brake protein YcgR n=1 Tax=Zestomonas carbonaria TaxID=2762745 RepID=A0A7U7EP25_9GAMM|nr:flagellar brake protein [Pseudomonas carbonaria]CAD5108563.1 Flagellar brake protein YcgR [Pseudomonas carbonaria]
MLALEFQPGDARTVSNPFNADNGPQPPRVLTAPLEIYSNLRLLQQHHDPLVITFHERSQRFQTYLIEVNRERGYLAFDELIPNDGERFLSNGESFKVEGFHEGVRIAWECQHPVQFGELEGHRCYWSLLPGEVHYHQRRNAYRAPLKQTQMVGIELAGDKLAKSLKGQMLDISATGCKLRFSGDLGKQLQPGQVYERLTIQLPFGTLTCAVELRHVQYEEKLDLSFAGLRFHQIGGLEQRQIERFVYQLQREARRDEL